MRKSQMRVWILVAVLVLVVLGSVNQAKAETRYKVRAFLVTANGLNFSKAERKTIGKLRALAQERADLEITEITIEGKLKKLTFSDFSKGNQANITVALYPAAANLVQVGYMVPKGYFLAATPEEALTLLKQYL